MSKLYQHELQRRQQMLKRALPIFVTLGFLVLSSLIYVPAFDAPFLFDSLAHVEYNENVKSLSADWFTGRRWLVYLTFALNYEMFQGKIWSFHLVNLVIHVASALVLFGIVLRTLWALDRFPTLKENHQAIAIFSALIWLVHPLQTQSVIYTVQRMESMMGLFFLLSMYAYIRYLQSKRSGLFWLLVSTLCCYLSAFCKEVAVAIPVVILLFNYVFGGEIAEPEATKSKPLKIIYGVVISCVVLLFADPLGNFFDSIQSDDKPAVLISENDSLTHSPLGSASANQRLTEINVEGLTPLGYAINQCEIVLYYFRCSIWPNRLLFDHGWPIKTAKELIFSIVATIVLILAGLYFWWQHRHPIGFVILGYFAILAPTSSFLPIMDMCVEHRLYVPLALIVVTFCGGLAVALKKIPHAFTIVCVIIAIVLSTLSYQRCQIYRSREAMWQDVIAKAPENPRGYLNLANVLTYEPDGIDRAIENLHRCKEIVTDPEFRIPATITPAMLDGHLGTLYSQQGINHLKQQEMDAAKKSFDSALEYIPDTAEAHINMGNYYLGISNKEAAKSSYRRAVELDDSKAERINKILGYDWRDLK